MFVTYIILLPLIMFFLAFAFKNQLVRKVKMETVSCERTYWMLFTLTMAAGLWIRCGFFDQYPKGLFQDSVMAGVEAMCLSSGGVDQYGISWPTYFTAWGYSQMSTLYSYLMIPFIKLMGVSKMTLRLPMLLVSIAVLPVVWDLARRILGKQYALIVLLIAATNPWHALQSRWVLESQLMPQTFLFAVYLLYLGLSKRWALYLSMVIFGLTPYAYGLASFSTPVFLILASVYCIARKKVHPFDLIICIIIFFCVSGMYYYTMMINAFGWETAMLGPVTMPRFPESVRANDLSLTQENTYLALMKNLSAFLEVVFQFPDGKKGNPLGWTSTMYPFLVPTMLFGTYKLWRDRRELAQRDEEHALRDGGMLILIWLFAAVVNGLIVGGVDVRNNILYFPMMFASAYAIHEASKRSRLSAYGIIAIIISGFCVLNAIYFCNDAFKAGMANSGREGYYDALVSVRDKECDRYYISISHEVPMAAEANVMYAHQIDYAIKSGEKSLASVNGTTNAVHYDEKYCYTRFEDFVPSIEENAVYIVHDDERKLFSEEDFIFEKYGMYWVAYPYRLKK